MEIEYGSLSNPKQLERTLFYFRAFEGEVPASYGPEDPQHVAKLEDLKGRIRKLAGGAWSCHNISSGRPTASGIRPWCPWRGGYWKKQSKRVHPAVLLMEEDAVLCRCPPLHPRGMDCIPRLMKFLLRKSLNIIDESKILWYDK